MKRDVGEQAAQVLLALLKSMCYLALFLGSQVLVMMPVVVFAAVRTAVGGGAVDEYRLYQALAERAMGYSLVANLLTLFVIMAVYLIRRKKFSEALWLRRVDGRTLWAGASLAPALYLAVIGVLYALPRPLLESYGEASAGVGSGGLVGVLAVAVAAPVVEEVVFRGLIMTRLGEAMPGWLAVLLSAAVFGACHGHPVWSCYAFVLGMFFGFMDLRAGSIWPSILAHLVFNGIGQIISALPDSGTAEAVFLAVLAAAAVVLPILSRRGIAQLLRRRPKEEPVQPLPAAPGVYDFDPWDA